MSDSLNRDGASFRVRPAWLVLVAAGMSFGIGNVAGQTVGGPTGDYPEEVPVYEGAGAIGGGAHPADATEPKDTDDTDSESGVSVSEYLTVDIFVQDEDLANVLQMLSLQSRRNIVASRDVAASVSANLYGVTFYEALDAILNVNGYSWYEEGSFIYVVTATEAQAREEAQREVVAKVIQLNYLNANDAAEFVTPLLSEVGQIKTNGDVGEYSLPADAPAGGEDFANASTLVIYDYPEHVAEVEALLDQLDTRPAQVLVEATILQTALTEANAFGVDFAILADMDFLDFFNFGGPLGSASALGATGANEVLPVDGRGASFVGNPGNFAGPGTFKAGIIYDDIGVFIRALDQVSDTTVLSNPKVLALNRQPARVLVGRKLGYLNTTSTETATTQTVEFLDTGTQLAFRPFIAKDGNVRMELKPRVSEGVIREATDVTGAAVTIPDEITQELSTNVIVPDGATIVLGGLFKETSSLSRSQVPVLGDIPILGAAFRGHDDQTDRAEIIFMIKPTIVNDTIISEQGQRGLEFVENVRTGTRNGLLPWSRDRQTMQLNVKAQNLAMEGKTDRAIWELRRSLELNPSQPIAIRMLEQISGEKDDWPNPSMLDRILEGEVENTVSYLGDEMPFDRAMAESAGQVTGPVPNDPWGIFDTSDIPVVDEVAPDTFETADADWSQTDADMTDSNDVFEMDSVEDEFEESFPETDVADGGESMVDVFEMDSVEDEFEESFPETDVADGGEPMVDVFEMDTFEDSDSTFNGASDGTFENDTTVVSDRSAGEALESFESSADSDSFKSMESFGPSTQKVAAEEGRRDPRYIEHPAYPLDMEGGVSSKRSTKPGDRKTTEFVTAEPTELVNDSEMTEGSSSDWFEEIFGPMETDPAEVVYADDDDASPFDFDPDAFDFSEPQEIEVSEVDDDQVNADPLDRGSEVWMDLMFESIEGFGKAEIGNKTTSTIVVDAPSGFPEGDPTIPGAMSGDSWMSRYDSSWFETYFGDLEGEAGEPRTQPVVNGLPVFNWWFSPAMSDVEESTFSDSSALTTAQPDQDEDH